MCGYSFRLNLNTKKKNIYTFLLALGSDHSPLTLIVRISSILPEFIEKKVFNITKKMDSFSHVPPGFRFHPTDEELVDYYLRKKVASKRIDLDVIKDVDLYKIEPWDLQELCKIGSEEESDWYFFSHKDKKYPTGTRTNRATKAGFWKATGRDKAIYSKHNLIGMRKTLVFYRGRAPNGQKSDWIMHEYRLETNENGSSQEEGWVVCKVFKKKMTVAQKEGEHERICWYDEQVSFMPDFDSPTQMPVEPTYSNYNNQYICKQELEMQYNMPNNTFLQLPYLESPKVQDSTGRRLQLAAFPSQHLQERNEQLRDINMINELQTVVDDQATTDWRVLDKFVASQFDDTNSTNL